jgi:hypothetical protein
MKRISRLIVFIFLLIACNNSGSSKSQKSSSDSLMDEVMEGHNIGMAKMSKINTAKNKIQHMLDSIASLPSNLQKNSTQYRMQLDSVFNRLTVADYNMEKWMTEFNMDSLKDNEQKRIEYLESEKIKISSVNNALIISLQKADSLFTRNR